MSRMADSFHNISASYMMKNRAQEFVTMEEYVKTFSEKLASLDRISQRILKEEYGRLKGHRENIIYGTFFNI